MLSIGVTLTNMPRSAKGNHSKRKATVLTCLLHVTTVALRDAAVRLPHPKASQVV
jgi:hypothetical protein